MVLQDTIFDVLEEIFSGVRLQNSIGDYVPVKRFKQIIPFIDYFDNADGYVRNVPGCSVFFSETRTNLHEHDGEKPCEEAIVFLCFTTYDNGNEGQGHRDIMMLSDLVKRRFRAQPVLPPHFICQRKMSFSLDSREAAPYFEGGMQLVFEIPLLQASSDFI
jgi:hypothetical protein